ncbi:tyrosine-type recombinase/integrase [Aegicerativicinus sediminis]|uniref:tyrosine-type recombinase/integrase n=1 Tax=Aegicerativicinus sediminis TaxID=2893202 RepID=UPI001E428246|nr:tyrosine-type recombinase/integrase [Aegicerativicinus sediminis]
MAKRITLPNGCSMSTPSVNPGDWKSGGISLLDTYWRIQYYFYDPSHPRKRKLVVVKGMNEFHTLNERRMVTKSLIEDEINNNHNGFNPLLGKFVEVIIREDKDLHPDLKFLKAFRLATERISCTDEHRKQIEWCLDRLEKSIDKMKIGFVTISNLKRSELKRIFDHAELSPSIHNKYLAYISSLFKILIEYECCEINLARDISRKKVTVKEREVMSPEQHRTVVKYLKNNYESFYRYAVIFFHSAARSAELMRLQAKDVDIKNQEYKVLVKKGKYYREVTKVILKAALPFWKEALKGAKPDDYIFSKGLSPGLNPIKSNQITKRWYRLVKQSDKIKDDNDKVIKVTADFYSMKHSFLDSISEEDAQKMADHTTSKTTAIYRTNQKRRDREVLKNMEVKLKVV